MSKKSKNRPVEITLTLDISFDMLDKQKRLLLKQLKGHPESLLWGIIHMIDDIQDKAEEQGLWKFDICGDDFMPIKGDKVRETVTKTGK